MITRRQLITAAAIAPFSAALAATQRGQIRIGLTPVILDNRLAFLREWDSWLSAKIIQPVRFVQRAKYREIMDLLLGGQLEAAWICGYPYVRNRAELNLLAVPLYHNAPWYQSFIIVHRRDRDSARLEDLRGKVFAFSDPDSNSGYLYPTYRLKSAGLGAPEDYFSRHFFTWGHRHVIEAVGSGLAEAGAVDSYVWEQLKRLHPELTAQTRVIERSPRFGFPPLVTRRGLNPELHQGIQHVLVNMDHDHGGAALLRSLGLTGFAPESAQIYASIERMAQAVAPAHTPAAT